MLSLARCRQSWVVGDSTANNQNHRGWADPFTAYFDPAKATVVNRARAGRSSRTFVTEGLWDKVRAELKPGDWVLIQFGHNDGGPPDQDRARGSLPGLGEEAREFTLPNGSHEVVYTFGHYLRRMIAETREAGAHPVVLSLTVRNIWKDGKVERGSGQFSAWSAEVAKAAGVPFLDVTNAIADQYDRMGEAQVKAWFPEDHTHTSPEGADFNARMVVAAIKGSNSPLTAFFPPTHRLWSATLWPLSTANLHLPEPGGPALPDLFLVGDSTVHNGRGEGANRRWERGEPLVDRFDTTRVNVVNRAVGGLSSRTFLTQHEAGDHRRLYGRGRRNWSRGRRGSAARNGHIPPLEKRRRMGSTAVPGHLRPGADYAARWIERYSASDVAGASTHKV